MIELPARSYLVFRQVLTGGPLHPQMQSAVREIWGERVPKSGCTLERAPDLEVYPDDFDPTRHGAWVEWWIPVQDSAPHPLGFAGREEPRRCTARVHPQFHCPEHRQ